VTILPSTYEDYGIQNGLQRRYFRLRDSMSIIVTEELHEDKWWRHVSCANNRKKTAPTFEDLKEVKNIFIGRDKKALQVFPNEKYYVNIHPRCLHLFSCLEDDGLPEFSHFGQI
jgi:hypothetical protein